MIVIDKKLGVKGSILREIARLKGTLDLGKSAALREQILTQMAQLKTRSLWDARASSSRY